MTCPHLYPADGASPMMLGVNSRAHRLCQIGERVRAVSELPLWLVTARNVPDEIAVPPADFDSVGVVWILAISHKVERLTGTDARGSGEVVPRARDGKEELLGPVVAWPHHVRRRPNLATLVAVPSGAVAYGLVAARWRRPAPLPRSFAPAVLAACSLGSTDQTRAPSLSRGER